jgi:transposase
MAGKTGKNDAADAIAICEAVQRPHMRFVPVKDESQQAMQCLHRTRQGFIQERTATYNRLRGLISNLGLSPHKALMLCVILFLTRGNSASTGVRLVLMIYCTVTNIEEKSPNMTGHYLVWPKQTIAASS